MNFGTNCNSASNQAQTQSDIGDLLNKDNTFLNSIDVESLGEASGKLRKHFSLSLNKPNQATNKQLTKRSNENIQLDLNNKRCKNVETKNFQLNNFDDKLDNLNLNKNSSSSSCADSFEEFDAFKTYLNENLEVQLENSPIKDEKLLCSQFFTNTQVLNQIENAISNEETEKMAKNTIENLFNGTLGLTQKNIDSFFNQIHDSITENGGLRGGGAPEELINVILTHQTQNDDLNLILSNNSIDSSFGTAMRQALLENASKFAQNLKNPLNASIKTQLQPIFKSRGPFYGLPLKVKELIKLYKGINELYEWQDECLKLEAIENRRNLIYALPTSGGKTLVAEILMLREVICFEKNAIFVLPFVAIVQEKVWALSPFGVALDFLVEEYAAGKGNYPPRKRRRKRSIYIATIEKALGLINSLIETGRLSELGLIVVDELHLVGETGRGAILETLLAKLRYIEANIQIVAMSATIGNIRDLCQFLDAEVYSRNFRPVELVEYIKCGSEIARINWNKNEDELFTIVRKIDFGYSDAVSSVDPDRIGGLVMEIIPKGSCLIFCHSKRNCENVAYLLCRVAFKHLTEYRKNEKEQILHGLRDESGALCKILKISIQFGIAYHHSGLTSEERRIIEDGFRAGIISVICCTSTLAAGVNLPAKRVILRQPYVGRDFISLSKYKQMVGRAGRAGLGETGESILMCSSQDLPKVKKLLLSPMDKACSSLHSDEGRGLRHLFLSCISLGIANTRSELQNVVQKTLLAVQSNRLDVDVKKLTDQAIRDLFKLGALQENVEETSTSLNISASFLSQTIDDEGKNNKRKVVIKSNTKLVISKLGCAAIRGNLELTRAHILYDDLHKAQSSLVLLDSLHLLYLVTPYDLAEQTRPNKNDYYNIFCKLSPSALQTAKILGIDDAVAMKMLSNQQIKTVSQRVLNRFYLSLMLFDLWNEMPVFEASEKYQISRGIVQNLMTSTATFASNVVHFCEGLEEFWTFAHLIKGINQRLSHCCIRELLPLMELPSVKQNRAKQLFNAGYKTLQSIAKASVDGLVEDIEFMPRRLASQLIAASKMLLLEKVENLREEAEDVLEGVENAKPSPSSR